jgi:hypothetical protein
MHALSSKVSRSLFEIPGPEDSEKGELAAHPDTGKQPCDREQLLLETPSNLSYSGVWLNPTMEGACTILV